MNLKTPYERLTRQIGAFAQSANQARQVAKRLKSLLPERLRELKREHARSMRPGKAERTALADDRYLEAVEEYVRLQSEAREARVQYETHWMLVDARKSLRHWHSPSPRPRS